MNPQRFVILSFAALAAGISISSLAQSSQPGSRVKMDSHRSLGGPKTFKNLTLIPVYDIAAAPGNRYITLDEGLKAGVAKVKESGQGGEVNTLFITNLGRKPLYVMAGEVVLGGQQDRCLGRDTIIPSQKKAMPVAVFCVEHGRWTGHNEFQESAKTVAANKVRVAAQEGTFKAAAALSSPVAAPVQVAMGANPVISDRAQTLGGISETRANRVSGRLARRPAQQVQTDGAAAIGDAQQKVWSTVAEKNAKFKSESPTGTYRGVLNLSSGEAQKSVAPYISALIGAADSDPKLVGMVAAVNGKFVSSDVFSDPTLFRKLWPKLLRSYAAEAAESSGTKADAKPMTPAEARTFLVEASDGKSKAQAKSDNGVSWRVESQAALSYRLVPNAPGAKGALHENVLRK